MSLAVSHGALAQNAAYAFDIPAGPLSLALQDVAKTSGKQIIFADRLTAGKSTTGLHGTFTVNTAMDQLLSGTDLSVSEAASGGIVVKSKNVQAAANGFGAAANDAQAPVVLAQAGTPSPQASSQGDSEVTEVIVTRGIRNAIKSTIATKRESNQIVDSVTAEDVGKLPDATVGDVLQRVPGVQVAKTFGEAGLVVIRGLQSNRTEVDGRASYGWIIDSANGFNEQLGRNFGFSSLTSNIVARVDVFKTPMASQVEGGLGGVINSRTYQALDFNEPTLLVSARGSIGTHGGGGTEYTLFGATRLGDRLGIFVGGVLSNEPFYLKGYTRGRWDETSNVIDQNGDGKRDIRPTNIKSENFTSVARKRTGLHANIQYEFSDELMLTLDSTYTNFATDRYINQAQFNILRNVAITNPVFDGNYVVAGTTTGSFDAGVNPRFETIRTHSSAANLAWKTAEAEVTADIAHTTGAFIQRNPGFQSQVPNVQFAFDMRGEFPAITLAVPTSITNINNYGTAGGTQGSINRLQVDTVEDAARLDGMLKFVDSPLTDLRAGVRYSKLKQVRNSYEKRFGAIDPTSAGAINNIGPASAFNGTVASYGTLFSSVTDFNFPGFPSTFIVPPMGDIATGSATLLTSRPLTYNPPNYYNTREETIAGYLQADFEMDKIRGNIGVRVVRTEGNLEAFQFAQTSTSLTQTLVKFDSGYTDFLPSANIIISLESDLLLRFSASRTMARQALDQNGLAPNLIISVNATTPTLSSAQSGNPSLLPTRSNNFDASLEWYFAPTGVLAGTMFYKDVSGFPVRVNQTTVVPGLESLGPITWTRPVNSDSATIQGFEVSYQQTYDFLPEPFNGLGTIASFTYVDGKSDVTFPTGTTSIKLNSMPLVGVSPVSYSITGFYEEEGFNLHLSYNWRDDRLFALQSQANGPNGTFDATNTGVRRQYSGAAGTLDAAANYDITENITVFVEAQNLIPESSAPTYFTESEKFLWRRDLGETRYSLGFRAKL
ncbi:MAG TPA: TonB-dependent receptor [Rhizomicrobium sp.]|nr:TonB-dependent receptor [Rhizomicrobium sp.]